MCGPSLLPLELRAAYRGRIEPRNRWQALRADLSNQLGVAISPPLVTEFAGHLTVLGHTSLTVSGYDAAARHLAQWLTLAKIAVTDRFAWRRCRCPGIRREKDVCDGPCAGLLYR
jgi:hypothetical protein